MLKGETVPAAERELKGFPERGKWWDNTQEHSGGDKVSSLCQTQYRERSEKTGREKMWRLDVDFRLHFLGHEEPLMALREV